MRSRCHDSSMTTTSEKWSWPGYREEAMGSPSHGYQDPSAPVAIGSPLELRASLLPGPGGSGKFTCFLLLGQSLGLLSELFQGS